jgi:hypothetical protein
MDQNKHPHPPAKHPASRVQETRNAAEPDKAAREKAALDKAALDKAAREKAALEKASREMAARLAYLFAPLPPPPMWGQWFTALEQLDAFEPRPCLRSEHGPASRFVMRQVKLGAASHLLAVIRQDELAVRRHAQPPVGGTDIPGASGAGKRQDEREWLWPVDSLPPTDIIYDCGEERLHGKAKPILCDLSAAPLRVFAVVPTQVERLVLGRPGGRAAIGAADASGRVIAARLPFQVTLMTRGAPAHYNASTDSGWLDLSFATALATTAETTSSAADASRPSAPSIVRVRSLLNGLTALVRIGMGGAPELLEELWDPQPIQWR